jgi:uncharacterized protein
MADRGAGATISSDMDSPMDNTDPADRRRGPMPSVGACLIREIPRPSRPDPDLRRDRGRQQRFAALVSAYHGSAGLEADGTAAPVLVGWRRSGAGRPADVMVGGPALLEPGTPTGEMVIGYPPGARGILLSAEEVAERWHAIPCWVPVLGTDDALALSDPRLADDDELRPALEDCLLAAWHGPFGWLVLAEALTRRQIGDLVAEAAREVRQARSRAGQSQDQQVDLERLESRHREYRQAESTGLWRIRLLAGGADATAATRVAGLVAASADLAGLPYALAPGSVAGTLEEALSADGGQSGGRGHETPFVGSSMLLARLARTPETEVSGLRMVLRPDFDVTPETGDSSGESLFLGQVLDGNGLGTDVFRVPFGSLNRHTFVCGATGAGKSQTVRGLLEQASRHDLPWLVVEPAKAEYRYMGARLTETARDGVVVIRLGDPEAIPAGINPLRPEPGFPLQTHVDLIRALFLAAFQAEEPFPQVLAAALTRCYEQFGWDLSLGEPAAGTHVPGYPTLADLQRTALQVVEDIGYGREVTSDVRGFIKVRISSLRLGTTGRFFEGGHQLDFGRLLRRNVVFEIEDVGDDQDKAFVMGAVLIRLVEHLRVADKERGAVPAAGLRHLTVIEEAHRLLRNVREGGPAARAVELFAGMLAEVRAYGEGLVIAEQIPSKLTPDVIKNTAVKIVHRLPAQDDRDAVGATMNVTPAQSEHLVTVQPGVGAVFVDGMDYPVLTRMPDGTGRETTRDLVGTPAPLVAPRSPACGADCVARPCSLREIVEAQRPLRRHGYWLWTELAVVAHLVGLPMAAPGPAMGEELRAWSRRSRDCLISAGAEAAVHRRAPALAKSVTPAALAAHIAQSLRAQADGAPGCAAGEPEWLAEEFRWNLVYLALRARHDADPAASRHPDSGDWERQYGRDIPGAGCAEQLQAVDAWRKEGYADKAAVQVLRFGVGSPSAVEEALGSSATSPDWRDRLRADTRPLRIPHPLLLEYLVPP